MNIKLFRLCKQTIKLCKQSHFTYIVLYSSHSNVLFKPPANVRAKVDEETPTPGTSEPKKRKGNPKDPPTVKYGIYKYRLLEYNHKDLICRTSST